MGCISSNNRGFDLDSLGTMRKTPDKTKNSSFNSFKNFSFATSEMCGKPTLTQDGDNIWKTP